MEATTPRPALLVLEDGRAFAGRRFGAEVDGGGEVVFNTSMTGYQEILSDPSYAGQMVVMTYPMIGNYGLASDDFESRGAFLAGLVVKEPSCVASNWRSQVSLDAYLARHHIPGICDLDTRALVRHLRSRGVMRGVIGPAEVGVGALAARARTVPSMAGQDLATGVSVAEPYRFDEGTAPAFKTFAEPPTGSAAGARLPFDVVAMDFGIKRNILRCLVDLGAQVTVVPARTPAEDILALRADGVLLSNGPGDPEPLAYAVKTIRSLLGRLPIFGICLGHQLLGLAAGGKTYKLKFGHRGANHPVMDMSTRKVEVTSHNHGFAVDAHSLRDSEVEITHVDLNDGTVEGLRLKHVPAFGVQYHPEAAAGPHDALYLFRRFAALMDEHRRPKPHVT
jgi:carbamoyl-phosphate synthase small subunit